MEHVALVLNWVWQGCAVAAGAAVLLRMFDRARAQARYGTAAAALLLVLMVPVAASLAPWPEANAPAQAMAAAVSPGPPVTLPNASWPVWVLASAWVLWAAFEGRRLCAAVAALCRTRRRCRPLPAGLERERHPAVVFVSAVRLVGLPAARITLQGVQTAVSARDRPILRVCAGRRRSTYGRCRTSAVAARRTRAVMNAGSTLAVEPRPPVEGVAAGTVPVLDRPEAPDVAATVPVVAATEALETMRLAEVLDLSALTVQDRAGASLPSGTSGAAPSEPSSSPWRATADAGIVLGQGSVRVGTATVGFFTRVGRRIAGSF